MCSRIFNKDRTKNLVFIEKQIEKQNKYIKWNDLS